VFSFGNVLAFSLPSAQCFRLLEVLLTVAKERSVNEMSTATDLRVVMATATNQTQSLAISPTQPCDDPALPRLKPELDLNDSSLFAVYCFIKNFIG
jgi:hypothetical protein